MKRYFLAVLALSLLLLAGCAKEKAPTAQNDNPAISDTQSPPQDGEAEPKAKPEDRVYTAGELEIPIPADYAELLVVDTSLEAWNEHWTPLASISEKASLDDYTHDNPDEDAGAGWLCSIQRLDRIGFEAWLSEEETSGTIFARDAQDRYYLLSRPASLTFYRSDKGVDSDEQRRAQWALMNEWADTLGQTLAEHNALEPYSASEYFDLDYTYEGKHVELGCNFPGQSMNLVILSLSQPVRQGEGGIWCVERLRYFYSAYDLMVPTLVFPAAYGVDETAADYYARLQSECDAGEHPELLTPRGAALDYARHATWTFGEDVSESDFETIETMG